MKPFDTVWLLLKNDPEGIEGEYQCGSCENFFSTHADDGYGDECPHCGSGNWVKGAIDDPYSEEELQEIEEQEASEAQMKRSLAESIRQFGLEGMNLDLPDYSKDFEEGNQ
tara:strand:+ start:1921 stop:2253 length:333 start_codon:yes stop_codon:yes gene_type:complete